MSITYTLKYTDSVPIKQAKSTKIMLGLRILNITFNNISFTSILWWMKTENMETEIKNMIK